MYYIPTNQYAYSSGTTRKKKYYKKMELYRVSKEIYTDFYCILVSSGLLTLFLYLHVSSFRHSLYRNLYKVVIDNDGQNASSNKFVIFTEGCPHLQLQKTR